MRKVLCIVTVCFMILTVFSGCGLLGKLGLGNGEDELHPVSSIVMNEDEAKKLSDKMPIHLYFANGDSSKLKLEVRYIPVTDGKKSVNSLASVIVKELIKGPEQSSGLKSVIPAGTQLRSAIKINAGVAEVDLTKEFVDKHPGGKIQEQLTIYSIVNSLTELKEIQKVKFLINGKVQKDYKGSFQFDVPFPRSVAIISKDSKSPSVGVKDVVKKDTGNTKPESPKPTDSSKQPDNKNSVSKSVEDQNDEDSTASVNVDDEAVYSDVLE